MHKALDHAAVWPSLVGNEAEEVSGRRVFDCAVRSDSRPAGAPGKDGIGSGAGVLISLPEVLELKYGQNPSIRLAGAWALSCGQNGWMKEEKTRRQLARVKEDVHHVPKDCGRSARQAAAEGAPGTRGAAPQVPDARLIAKTVDDGHKIRVKVLAKQMAEAVEIRDALEARALRLHLDDHPAKDWVKEFQGTPLEEEDEGPKPREDLLAYFRHQQVKLRGQAALNEHDDLIGLRLRSQREACLKAFQHILEPDIFWREYPLLTGAPPQPETPENLKIRAILTTTWLQYTRRIIFHDPHLLAKSLNKVSLKEFAMDDDFGFDDVVRILILYEQRLTVGLRWWKDSMIEAIAIRDNSEASANMGTLVPKKDFWPGAFARRAEVSMSRSTGGLNFDSGRNDPISRVHILGGWIYNNTRNTPAPNKVWWTMLTSDRPEKDTENRYVRLCCNFDELHTFLTFSAFVLDAPSFCVSTEDPSWDSKATRNHLSLCGVLVTAIVNGSLQKHKVPAPIPAFMIPAKKKGCITWLEAEFRGFLFGAIRNEPDEFTTGFLQELRARPDLFTVVTRSDTDPPLQVECFGEVTDQMRKRQFEAPFHPLQSPPEGRGTWETIRSATEALYGKENDDQNNMKGFLTAKFNSSRDGKGRPMRSFFFHKKFPIKYFLILDASPTGNVHDLARQVAWAAFRAQGLVHGNYDERKYEKASDVLFTKHARERLSFLPEGGYTVGNLMSQD
ncbi:hypothetical protein FB451DRAFT_1188122 [Mycena latifolia]|nr:hypothetical protein FB451DRAFT_1188122 [Mycena latifolia]